MKPLKDMKFPDVYKKPETEQRRRTEVSADAAGKRLDTARVCDQLHSTYALADQLASDWSQHAPPFAEEDVRGIKGRERAISTFHRIHIPDANQLPVS